MMGWVIFIITYSRRSMAEIKRIQLRGISRSPSDRMTEDGGVAESLNVQLDNTEVAPSLLPIDMRQSLDLPENMRAKKIYIHTGLEYSNIITHEYDEIYAYVRGIEHLLLTIREEDVINDISSVGNILIISTQREVYYLLWKNGKYTYIGNRLPAPHIQFEAIGNDDDVFQGNTSNSIRLDTSGAKPGRIAIATFNKSVWSQAAKGVADEEQNTYLQQVNEELWAGIQELKEKIGRWGYFSCPRLVRYAIRLYDGSYVYHSVPILIGPGAKEWVSVTGSKAGDSIIVSSLKFSINMYYRAVAKLIRWDVEGWEDIISGVDIFISTDITHPIINQNFETCDEGGGKIYFKGYDESFERTKQEILSKANFYKIESIAVGDLQSLKNGIDLHRDNDVEKEEDLILKERLTSDYMTSHRVIPSDMSVFNNRLLINANVIELPAPYSLLNGLFGDVNEVNSNTSEFSSPRKYQMKFHIRRNNGEEFSVMARNPNGGYDLTTPLLSNGAPSILETKFYTRPMAWLAYPDPNCYAAEIYLGGGDVVDLDMYQHPGLSCSYAFVGMDVFLDEGRISGDMEYDYEEKTKYNVSNQVMLSMVNNPFVFPASQRYSLQSRVLGASIATQALSQGQFGQFPLYVFTEDGIWAMETATDGSFLTSKPVSRDVCVNPDSITSIDNAVIFVSAKGVMLLQGSQVTNISPFMNGRHYTIESGAKNIIENQDFFCDLLPALSDQTHFLAFVKEATVAYDYSGQRLIFIKKDEKYQYVYKLDTQTWHKVAYGVNLIAPLNSYPKCLIQGEEEGKTRIYYLPTILDAAQLQTTMRGVIATRPFDLGEPDVFKTITDVRIRGQFPRGAAKFILLGSNDGVNFTTISTLRGRSWKLFRMIILADLAPTERISWVDVQYETKFTNKLR